MNRGPVLLVHAGAVRMALPGSQETGPARWLCLVADPVRATAWDRRLSGRFARIDIARRLDEAAERLRPLVIDWLDGLARTYAYVPQWWLSHLSERNPAVSPFFLHVCYLAVAVEVFDEDEPRIVIAEDWGLIEALSTLIESRGRTAVVAGEWRKRVARLLAALRVAVSPAYFLIAKAGPRAAAAWWTSRGRSPISWLGAGRRVLLKTYFHQASMTPDDVFRDRYFPELHEFLAARGLEVWALPVLADSTPSPAVQFAWMRRSSTRFIIAEDWLRPVDYVAAAIDGLRLFGIPRTVPSLAGLDVEPLVAQERRRQAGSGAPRAASLLGRLPARLAQAGFRPDQVVAWSENHAHDKAFVAGCRRSFPRTPYIAVQNTLLPPNLLNLFPTPVECDSHVVGDRHVCSGPLASAILKAGSGGRLRTLVGCGLRYGYLWKHAAPPRSARADFFEVLVLLPVSLAQALEMLEIVAPLAAARAATAWWVKPHPDYPADLVRNALPAGSREKLTFVDGAPLDWIRRAACVVTSGSGAALEAVALGVPVVRLGSRAALNLDPLAWHEECGPKCFTPEELSDALERISRFDTEDYDRLRGLGEQVRAGWFAPVTEQGLASFVA